MSRLLLVDDEPTLLQLLKRYLERQGYEVETYESAEQALVVFQANPQGYDMLITDLTLPGLNGAELMDRLREKNATLPGLISSGYPYEPQLKGVKFLQKPFLPQMLAEEIAKMLKP
jgi:two-component system, cell cycle sensor histidine kinase and response regulator CckA